MERCTSSSKARIKTDRTWSLYFDPQSKMLAAFEVLDTSPFLADVPDSVPAQRLQGGRRHNTSASHHDSQRRKRLTPMFNMRPWR
jgi:hypothetical protein